MGWLAAVPSTAPRPSPRPLLGRPLDRSSAVSQSSSARRSPARPLRRGRRRPPAPKPKARALLATPARRPACASSTAPGPRQRRRARVRSQAYRPPCTGNRRLSRLTRRLRRVTCERAAMRPSNLAEITCPSLSNDGNAAWPTSFAGTDSVAGTCVSGYTGAPTRSCSITGSFGAIQNACTRTSSALRDRRRARQLRATR